MEDQVKRKLSERARTLAAPRHHDEESSGSQQVVVFMLSGQAFSFGSADVKVVRRSAEIFTLPSLPPFARGVYNYLGRIFAVLDIKPVLGLEAHADVERADLLLLADENNEFAIITDGVTGVDSVENTQLRPPLPGVDEPGLLLGQSASGITCLNAKKILQMEKLKVGKI